MCNGAPICILTLLIYFNLSLNYYHYNYLEIDTLLASFCRWTFSSRCTWRLGAFSWSHSAVCPVTGHCSFSERVQASLQRVELALHTLSGRPSSLLMEIPISLLTLLGRSFSKLFLLKRDSSVDAQLYLSRVDQLMQPFGLGNQ